MRSILEKLAKNRILEDHEKLNPLLFNDKDQLHEEISMKILEIVQAFLDYIEVQINVIDIRLVGSNVAYNYTDGSDLDVHIVTNLSEISDPEVIARLYFDSVKKNFKDSYDIKIKGIEVELYVEDVNTTSISNGIYSVFSDGWIKYPTPLSEPSQSALDSVEVVVNSIKHDIETAETSDDLQDVLDSLYIMRKDALSTSGENAPGNLVFKAIRNAGLLDSLKTKLQTIRSNELSLESRLVTESIIVGEKTDDGWEHYTVSTRREAEEKLRDILPINATKDEIISNYSCSDNSVDILKLAELNKRDSEKIRKAFSKNDPKSTTLKQFDTKYKNYTGEVHVLSTFDDPPKYITKDGLLSEFSKDIIVYFDKNSARSAMNNVKCDCEIETLNCTNGKIRW